MPWRPLKIPIPIVYLACLCAVNSRFQEIFQGIFSVDSSFNTWFLSVSHYYVSMYTVQCQYLHNQFIKPNICWLKPHRGLLRGSKIISSTLSADVLTLFYEKVCFLSKVESCQNLLESCDCGNDVLLSAKLINSVWQEPAACKECKCSHVCRFGW